MSVTVPADAGAGDYTLLYSILLDGNEYSTSLETVRLGAPGLTQLPDDATCVAEEHIVTPACVDVHLVEARFADALMCGYVRGADESIPQSLSRVDLKLREITDEEINEMIWEADMSGDGEICYKEFKSMAEELGMIKPEHQAFRRSNGRSADDEEDAS